MSYIFFIPILTFISSFNNNSDKKNHFMSRWLRILIVWTAYGAWNYLLFLFYSLLW